MLSLLRKIGRRETLACLLASALLLPAGTADASPLPDAGGKQTYAAGSRTETAAKPESRKPGPGPAAAGKPAGDPLADRRQLYDQMEAVTGIPWYRLAAVDQYERSLARSRKDNPPASGRLTAIRFTPEAWSGPMNPDSSDTNPASIRFFRGLGRDGSGDGRADPQNDTDVLTAIADVLGPHGISDSDFAIAVWEYYHNGRASQRIGQYIKLYRHFGRLDLSGGAFPLPVGNKYAYRSTWGTGRSWGGARIHEGTDLFAPHGTTVRSTCIGVIETKGWNRFGGWRIGIRDIEGRYHYYAHLSGFDKSLNQGDIVSPGQTIGWVGSSGYGKPGTQGKFPPHLHFGVYKDRGLTEWAFDPYPLLRQWEQQERQRIKRGKH